MVVREMNNGPNRREANDDVRSPCVGICALDDDDVCVGCFRTGMEICRWGEMTKDEKNVVMNNVRKREEKSYF